MSQAIPDETSPSRYSLLQDLLLARGDGLKGLYTVKDVAKLFGVSERTIQAWIARGRLNARDLPGRGRFLSQDLETFLINSRKKPVN
jgi:excisionase family DNA binding protein